MPRILIVKLSSMGDVIHLLPALSDVNKKNTQFTFDWVVDKSFSEIPHWHSAVSKVISTSHRKWKKNWIKSWRSGEIRQALQTIREEPYDLIIDAQGSIKSALISLCARGKRYGMDKNSAREFIAAYAYHKTYCIHPENHAINRLRHLFSQIFDYDYTELPLDYGIEHHTFQTIDFPLPESYLVFIHSASWTTKLLPESLWKELIQLASNYHYHIVLPWGNELELKRAKQLAQDNETVHVLPYCSLSQQAHILKKSRGVISVDTGLSHLAAALGIKCLTLYGPTDPKRIGTIGENQLLLHAPFNCLSCHKKICSYSSMFAQEAVCMKSWSAEYIWKVFLAKS